MRGFLPFVRPLLVYTETAIVWLILHKLQQLTTTNELRYSYSHSIGFGTVRE